MNITCKYFCSYWNTIYWFLFPDLFCHYFSIKYLDWLYTIISNKKGTGTQNIFHFSIVFTLHKYFSFIPNPMSSSQCMLTSYFSKTHAIRFRWSRYKSLIHDVADTVGTMAAPEIMFSPSIHHYINNTCSVFPFVIWKPYEPVALFCDSSY